MSTGIQMMLEFLLGIACFFGVLVLILFALVVIAVIRSDLEDRRRKKWTSSKR